MVRAARAASTPLEIAGGRSRQGLGRPVQAERTLTSVGLAGISLYEPGALCLVAGAGTPLKDVEAALGAERQRLSFEPMDHRALLGSSDTEPTIGGIVACGVSGPRRVQAGACRDSLIGVRFVNGNGDIVKNGGRVMKNVTGYDLVKLLCGSYGTLGLLTEVSFKLVPSPEAEATIIVDGLDDENAVAGLSAALGSPYDISGAAHLTAAVNDGAAHTCIRIEGFETSVSYRAGRLVDLLAEFGAARKVTGEESTSLWRGIRDCTPFAGTDAAVWRVSVRPSDGPVLLKALASLEGAHGFYDWGGGLVWLAVPDEGDAGSAAIRSETARLGGHATLVRGSPQTRGTVPVFEPDPPAIAALADGIRSVFDPAGILNPGRMRA